MVTPEQTCVDYLRRMGSCWTWWLSAERLLAWGSVLNPHQVWLAEKRYLFL